MKIPTLISAFKCGFDTTHYDGIEYIDIEEEIMNIAKAKEPYVLQVSGDSMTPTIHHNDFLIVDRKDNGKHGDIVAVYLDGDHHVKRLNLNPNGITLVSDNNHVLPIPISDNSEFQILGAVKMLCRKMK